MTLIPDDPDARFGVVDIGSNTVRLVIFDGRTRSPAYFFNEKATCRLGAAMEATGALDPEGKIRAEAALRRFAAILEELKVDAVEAVATAALREADDGPDFALKLRKETGLPVRVISGPEEGRYAAMGVLMGDTRTEGLVVDIGGASMELATIRKGLIGPAGTSALGPLRLAASGLDAPAMNQWIMERIEAAWPRDATLDDAMTLVGGGWRAFAALDMNRRRYPLHVLQGYELTPAMAMETAEWAMQASEEDIQACGISRSRAWALPYTGRVLTRLIEVAAPSVLRISAFGLREGVLYERLSAEMRGADPLTQSAEVMERISGRYPGFGRELAEWLAPVLPEVPERLRMAACMLSDVNWRIHPDYRAQACFATATQSSLGGLTHPERIMLAVALAYRYKDARAALEQQPAAALLTPEQRRLAEALGRTIRLGAMLSAAALGVLPDCPIRRSEEGLDLTTPDHRTALCSDLVEKRLKSAADALSLGYALRAA